MKRLLRLIYAAIFALLAGCATTIGSDVTAFHAWPADLQDKSFVFAPDATQKDSLEYRNYAQLIRAELLRLGFRDNAKAAALKVAFRYDVRTVNMVVTQPLYDPFWYGPRWRSARTWGAWGPGPFYDPFWYGPPYQQTRFPVYELRLQVTIARADNAQTLHEVTVDSESWQATLPIAMPYMVRSAFSEFPGPSGVPRHVELKLDDTLLK